MDARKDVIFVSVASFRDPLCPLTLASALLAARRPQRVVFGLVDQGVASEPDGEPDAASFEPCAQALERLYGDEIRVATGCPKPGPFDCSGFLREIRVSEADSRGPAVARAMATSLLHGNDAYYMQIDSHTVFGPHWDTALIRMLNEAAELHNRHHDCTDGLDHAVISSYPNEYSADMTACDDELHCTVRAAAKDAHASALGADAAVNCISFIEPNIRLTFHQAMGFAPTVRVAKWSGLWAAGLSFSRASVWRAVPYVSDLNFLFHGEELLHAARLFTHGIDIFAPSSNVVYHKYAGRKSGSVYTSAAYGSSSAAILTHKSAAKAKHLLGAPLSPAESIHLDLPIPPADALGTARSLDDFWAYTLIDIQNLVFGERCVNTSSPDGAYLNMLPSVHARPTWRPLNPPSLD
ncbi:uncharacterized protein AMSG_02359 [Thecamonas trahens ATCC 50062]|uniref:Uncharacterized protein n=1 Tax=Thecamonas trahens ATCC 50062 TaxID=461836 RepID=A0A0L0DVZ4_THETB|nr:hypothetical protein AMSG_02359 [Thecamonas trahens ATCC 50062]KNC56390.1 hypothetical protein AMSG_02359 [Thecamonas trahens ATCC 50062]|eukprot:XP_013760904.1 hypothetical protein AMSG_02359 [Thecamonas trahens ATCC 50062]